MEAYISGLEMFVGWVEKYHPSHYTVKSIRNKAQSLLAEEKTVPIHADWKLREELGEYMDDLRNSASNDYADDLETILAKCPAVYFMEDRPSVAKTQEPLAVLACKKNSWIAFAGQTMGGKYRIDIETMNVPLAGDSCFMEEVYAEAEAESKARAYLESLTDTKGGE